MTVSLPATYRVHTSAGLRRCQCEKKLRRPIHRWACRTDTQQPFPPSKLDHIESFDQASRRGEKPCLFTWCNSEGAIFELDLVSVGNYFLGEKTAKNRHVCRFALVSQKLGEKHPTPTYLSWEKFRRCRSKGFDESVSMLPLKSSPAKKISSDHDADLKRGRRRRGSNQKAVQPNDHLSSCSGTLVRSNLTPTIVQEMASKKLI